MENSIIIRAVGNGGKTTTCGVLYEELSKKAEFSKLYHNDNSFPETDILKYDTNGSLLDFMSILIVSGKTIVIISQGDVALWLEEKLNLFKDLNIVKKLTNNLSDKIDFYVVCARSKMNKNSTIEMLYKRVPSNQRKDFWTVKSESPEEKNTSKKNVVQEIINHIGLLS